ncbi:MAG: hypothetical protein GY839_04865 [candidate division Zixibacteria bacterium]|nr:hypothetical protein [candidate division Zixibacteria bacterium]
MPKKSREYGGYFALIDIDFMFNNPRLCELSDGQKWFFICLWCLAIKERNPNLGSKWSVNYPKVISKYTHVHLKVVKSSLKVFPELGLIDVNASGEITVCGVKEKHPNLKWKDDQKPPSSGHFEFDYKETETETKTESISPAQKAGDSSDNNSKDEINCAVGSAQPEEVVGYGDPTTRCNSSDNNFKDEIQQVYNFYIKQSNRDPGRYKLTSHRIQKIKARLSEGFTLAQMSGAIQAVLTNPWNMGENPQSKKYIELEEHIFRSYEQTEKRVREFEDRYGEIG